MDIRLLNRFDLNTLVTLKVLLDEKHVTRAAQHLNLTQSAVSRTLSKLRQDFDDPLLVKSGKHLSLTAKAERLYVPLTDMLEQVKHLLAPETFNPKTAQGTIRIATNDYGSHTLLPRLIPLLNDVAPDIKITTIDWHENAMSELEQNKIDLLIAIAGEHQPYIHQKVIAKDDVKGVVRKGHPLENGVNLEQFLALKHILTGIKKNDTTGLDSQLLKIGKQRNIVVQTPHFFTALDIIIKTDFIISLPIHFIRRYVDSNKFSTVDIPVAVPDFETSMYWNARTHQDPLHKWFREFIHDNIYDRRGKNNRPEWVRPVRAYYVLVIGRILSDVYGCNVNRHFSLPGK